jgi:pentatricopeptide repeat protein
MNDRDAVTFNTMIGGLAQHGCGQEAFSLFLQMQGEGLIPDATTYVSILNVCTSTNSLEWVKEVHRRAVKAGLASDLRVGSALIHMYFKTGSIDDARVVFSQMVHRDTIIWTAMIRGLAQHGYVQEAFSFLLQMQREGFDLNPATYVDILSASESEGASEWVKEVHSHAVRAGLDMDLRVGNALIHTYVKSGSVDDAQLVFNKMVERNVTTWNSMIGGLAQHGYAQKAFLLFLQMHKEGYVPNIFTYVSLLRASANVVDIEWVKEVHSHAIKAGIASDVRVGSALIHTYAKSGSIDDARLVFNTMSERNVISWTVMIGGLAQHGRGHEAVQLFEGMKADGVKPNGYSFVAVLSACSHAGLVDEGRRQFLSMTQDYGIEPTMKHYTCMVDLLGRAGHLDEAKRFVLNMLVEPGLVPWRALLSACRSHGNLEMGVLAAKECLKFDPKDAKTYVLLSNIYAAASMWDQVSLVRRMMEGRGIHKEAGRSWIVIDHKVHCFIAGDTSHPEAKEIYAALQKLSEKLKAEGYVPNTRLVLRNFDEDAKEVALCSHSEKLAIAYGLMHSPPGKPIRVYKNLRVCSDCHTATKFISKVTGRQIVAKDAYRFHHFKDGMCSCGDYW